MATTVPREARPDVQTRNIDFPLDPGLPAHWHSNDPYISHFFNGLSITFPLGERFFIDSVRHFQNQVTDPGLRDEMRAFAGQEGIHGREHDRFNRWLRDKGYPVEAMERMIELGIRMDEKWPAKWQLAMTCALEHFTAIFADVILSDPRMLEGARPEIARLWKWHAVEETEHKAVAYDVYQTVASGFGGYLRRVTMMAIVTVLFLIQIVLNQSWLVHHDGAFWRLRARRRAFEFFWKRPGLLRKGLRHYRAYYRRDFHPWQIDNSSLIERWKSEYPELAEAGTGS